MDAWQKKVWRDVGIIVASFVLFWVAAYFLDKMVAAKGTAIIAARRVVAERSYALDNLSSLKRQSPEAAKFKEKIDALIPIQDSLLSFPQFLEGLARTHNVDLGFSFSGSPTPPSQTAPGFIGMTITLRGPLDQIRGYLEDLESKSLKFLTAVDSLDIFAEGGVYRAEIRGRTFFK